ncbi:hypothetical protein T12_15684 [Trichinella patagoniensis]|uniref:PiggyBac transposable element-derived protein domain-containing protein n=1 Tax=Trichinella patagoniensis TaxID=990121 RepID=A0A0V1A963_9BILA|nr:hypothetical protein T12_15684 [Trichinella patagoniensis]
MGLDVVKCLHLSKANTYNAFVMIPGLHDNSTAQKSKKVDARNVSCAEIRSLWFRCKTVTDGRRSVWFEKRGFHKTIHDILSYVILNIRTCVPFQAALDFYENGINVKITKSKKTAESDISSSNIIKNRLTDSAREMTIWWWVRDGFDSLNGG